MRDACTSGILPAIIPAPAESFVTARGSPERSRSPANPGRGHEIPPGPNDSNRIFARVDTGPAVEVELLMERPHLLAGRGRVVPDRTCAIAVVRSEGLEPPRF